MFPGIEVALHQYLADHIHFQHLPLPSVLEINHCYAGRMGWNMRDGIAIYLGEGDLCLHTMQCCADSKITLPLGYYEGITISLDFNELKNFCPQILADAGVRLESLYHKFCTTSSPLAIPSNEMSERVFPVLYGLPESFRIPYYKLKVQEFLLDLFQMDLSKKCGLSQHFSQQTELIKEIHAFLTQHLDQRFTIEEVSKKYLINTTSLKTTFKAVYGLPIATYMKEYRIHRAMEFLRTTTDSIAEIAKKIGYETQGKFTSTFKELTDILPTEYRKLYKIESR